MIPLIRKNFSIPNKDQSGTGIHWIAAFVEPVEQRIAIYDSLGLNYPQLEGIFKTFFEKVAQQNGEESRLKINYVKCPQQSDFSSCGLYCLNNILCLAQNFGLTQCQARHIRCSLFKTLQNWIIQTHNTILPTIVL